MHLHWPHLKLYNLEGGKSSWRNQLGCLPVVIKEKLLAEGYKSQRSLGFLKLLSLLKNFTNTWIMLLLLINEQGLKKNFKMMKILNVNIEGPTSGSKNVYNTY